MPTINYKKEFSPLGHHVRYAFQLSSDILNIDPFSSGVLPTHYDKLFNNIEASLYDDEKTEKAMAKVFPVIESDLFDSSGKLRSWLSDALLEAIGFNPLNTIRPELLCSHITNTYSKLVEAHLLKSLFQLEEDKTNKSIKAFKEEATHTHSRAVQEMLKANVGLLEREKELLLEKKARLSSLFRKSKQEHQFKSIRNLLKIELTPSVENKETLLNDLILALVDLAKALDLNVQRLRSEKEVNGRRQWLSSGIVKMQELESQSSRIEKLLPKLKSHDKENLESLLGESEMIYKNIDAISTRHTKTIKVALNAIYNILKIIQENFSTKKTSNIPQSFFKTKSQKAVKEPLAAVQGGIALLRRTAQA